MFELIVFGPPVAFAILVIWGIIYCYMSRKPLTPEEIAARKEFINHKLATLPPFRVWCDHEGWLLMYNTGTGYGWELFVPASTEIAHHGSKDQIINAFKNEWIWNSYCVEEYDRGGKKKPV